MIRAVGVEVKSSIRNLQFLCGVVLIVLVAIVSNKEMLQKILEVGYSPEEPGWFVAYLYFSQGANTLLFIPIAVTLAAGERAEEELHSRFSYFYSIRTGKKEYLVGKAMGLGISGGLMICLAMVILLIVSIVGFGRIPASQGAEYPMTGLVGKIIGDFFRLFLDGAFWALVGGVSAVVTKNRYMAYTVPFILYYVMMVFQERYYQRIFFLNPKYWANPSHYGNLGCICILLVLSLLIEGLLILAIKRRLEHA